MKRQALLLALTTALGVAAWVLFAVAGMPLDARDTAFVVAVCLALTYGIRGLWGLLQRARKRKDSRAVRLGGGLVLLATGLLAAAPRPAQALPPVEGTAPALVACAPEAPIARVGQETALEAWVLAPSSATPGFDWQVDAGAVEGSGRVVRWRLSALQPGLHVAIVRVDAGGLRRLECRLSLMVVVEGFELRGGHRESGRAWLTPGQEEDGQYGLRSYLLLGAPPATDAQRERCLRAIEAFLRFPAVEGLAHEYQRAGWPTSALNVVYLPMRSAPPPALLDGLDSPASYRGAAEGLLRRYDFERAAAILGGLEGEHHQGPYLVSFPVAANPVERPYIFQDQSWVPPELVSLWMRDFLNLAAQERDWSATHSASFVLKMRTVIALGGAGMETVQNELGQLVRYYEK